jgi:non-heme chloroperoxidase
MAWLTARDGAKVFYREQGTGDPIILLHGFGMNSLHWLPFSTPLSRNARVIMPDLRGFGRSHATNFSDPCVLTNYANDIHDLVTHLQLKHFKLSGISMGALTSLQYQKLHPNDAPSHYLHIDQSPVCMNSDEWKWGLFGEEHDERIARARELIEALSPYHESNTPYETLPEYLKFALWKELGHFFASAMSKQSLKSVAQKLCSSPRVQQALLPTENWQAYIICLKAYLDKNYDLRDTLREVDIPTTVVVGLKSEMYPKGGQLRIADYRKNSQLVPFEQSGHTPLIDEPIKFMKTLSEFASQTHTNFH